MIAPNQAQGKLTSEIKDETLFVYREWTDKHGLKRSDRVGPLRQVVSEYTEQIERLRAALSEAIDYVEADSSEGLEISNSWRELVGRPTVACQPSETFSPLAKDEG